MESSDEIEKRDLGKLIKINLKSVFTKIFRLRDASGLQFFAKARASSSTLFCET